MKFTLRIKKSKTFKYILKKGKYVKGEFLTIHICKTKYENSINFFGVCVSKKNGNSVQRNKLKRWVREVYKSEEQKLKKGYNISVHTSSKCKYYPTCSEYTKQAVDKYGIIKGSVLGIIRILKCNPFSKGGVDKLK